MDIQQIRTDYENVTVIGRPTWAELLAYVEQSYAVLNGRQQKIGEQAMKIAGFECRISTLEQDCRDWEKAHKDAVALPRQASNPAKHDWAAPQHDSDCSTNNAGCPELLGPCDCSLIQSGHTIAEDFEHFITTHGLGGEPADVRVKLFKAYEANWVGAAAPVIQAAAPELVTRDSALEAIGHVGKYNGRGREQEAEDMLVALSAPVSAQEPVAAPQANIVPGKMLCAKCGFSLLRTTLNVANGNAYVGDNKTEPCPNGCGPLWPITWEQEAREGYKLCDGLFERAKAAEDALSKHAPQAVAAADRDAVLEEAARIADDTLEGTYMHDGEECKVHGGNSADAIRALKQAPQPIAAPADPMDWPLPCDVKVGCGTHGKGTTLRSLVGRMQRLYDQVVLANPLSEGGLDHFSGLAASQQPLPAQAAAPVDLHAAIMNLRCNQTPLRGPTQCYFKELEDAYKAGHKEARHAAAELASAALAHPVAVDVLTCKLDLRTKLVGDGCDVCNHELSARCAKENAEDALNVRLEFLYQLACIKPFIAPITTKDKWLASIDAAIAAQDKEGGT